jgi:hypothetical protein
MPGPGNDALAKIFKVVADRIAANPTMDLPTLRASLEEFHIVAAEPTEVMYEKTTAGNCAALWEIPIKACDSPNVILYFQYDLIALLSFSTVLIERPTAEEVSSPTLRPVIEN